MGGVRKIATVAAGLLVLAACGTDPVNGTGDGNDFPWLQQADAGYTQGPGNPPPERPKRVLGEYPPVQAGVPEFNLEIAQADLDKLNADPGSDDRVPAVISLDGQRVPGALRYRGASSRWLPQKGFSIELDSGFDLEGRDHFQLIAQYPDGGKLSEKFALDLWWSLGAPASDARFVRLKVNGELWGLYVDMEHVGKDFLRMHAMEPDATIYRCGGRNGEMKIDPPGRYQQDFSKRTNESLPDTDMQELLRFLNRTDDAEFEQGLADRIDLDAYIANMAGEILISAIIVEDMRGFWIHELQRDKWSYAPWDLNNSHLLYFRDWAVTDPPITDRPVMGFTLYDPHVELLFSDRVQQYADQRPTWSVLNTRIWDRPALRNALLDKLEWAMNGPFSEPKALPHAEALWARIQDDIALDPFVDQLYAPHALEKFQHYLQYRREFLEQEMPALRNHGSDPLVINELVFDAPGQPGYVELHNRSLQPINLAGFTLTNNLRLPKLHALPGTLSVPANGFLRIPTSSLPFSLPTDGGELGLFDGQKVYAPFDAVYFGPHAPGTGYGRFPDGSEDFRQMTPTPELPNAGS